MKADHFRKYKKYGIISQTISIEQEIFSISPAKISLHFYWRQSDPPNHIAVIGHLWKKDLCFPILPKGKLKSLVPDLNDKESHEILALWAYV